MKRVEGNVNLHLMRYLLSYCASWKTYCNSKVKISVVLFFI